MMSQYIHFDANGNIIEQYDLPDSPRSPLDPTGALATLLAVTEVLDVDDAANAVGLTADDLVAEAQAWAMGQADPLQYNVI